MVCPTTAFATWDSTNLCVVLSFICFLLGDKHPNQSNKKKKKRETLLDVMFYSIKPLLLVIKKYRSQNHPKIPFFFFQTLNQKIRTIVVLNTFPHSPCLSVKLLFPVPFFWSHTPFTEKERGREEERKRGREEERKRAIHVEKKELGINVLLK